MYSSDRTTTTTTCTLITNEKTTPIWIHTGIMDFYSMLFKSTTRPLNCFYTIVLVILSGLCETGGNDHAQDFQKHIPVRVIWAVKGKDVDLPCDITTTVPGDYPKLILWFKDTTGIPLYSIDSRDRDFKFGAHSAIASDLGQRLFFTSDENTSRNARLIIKNVHDTDGGVYRCRVDFHNSATRNARINLTLVVPPDEPRIFDTHGKEVTLVAGPFREGQEFFLSCQVSGGNPPPKVSWWRSDIELPGTIHQSIATGAVINNILMRSVPRDYYATKLVCRAQGSQLIDPIEKEITVQLHLKPLKVKIVSANDIFSAGVKSPLRCEAWGSAPPAKITWFLDGIPIINADITSHSDSSDEGGNKTISIVTLTVTAENNDAELVCRASNAWFPSDTIEDKRIISVAYAPIVSVHLANEEPIPSRVIIRAERDNVTLKCRADANPPAESFAWFKNGMRMLGENTETLHLINLERQNIGEYACSSRNEIGENHSSTITLRVQYAPRCKPGTEQSSVGSINMHSIDVRCEVDADPVEPIRFSWTYNNTRNVSPVLNSRITSNGLVSTMSYLAPSDSRLTLACWASNAVGRQETPCLIHIIPAKLPEQPKHCELRNDTIFEVVCTAGNDGGLSQYFLLEVVGGNPISPDLNRNDFNDNNMITNEISTMNDQATTAPLRRIKEATPEFKLFDLEPGREYQFLVYAVNAKGRSHPPVVMQGKSFNDIVGPHDETILSEDPPTETSKQEKQRQSTMLMIGAGGAVAATSIIVALFAVLCRRRPSPQAIEPKPTSTEHQMKRLKPTRLPSMYAEDDALTDEFGRCADIRCAHTLGGHSTASHFISDTFVQYSQPSLNGIVELYQSNASVNMCS